MPINTWPKGPYYKQMGAWVLENLDTEAERLLMALFTRFLGWLREEVLEFSAEVRASVKDRSVHAYIPMWAVLFFCAATGVRAGPQS